MQRILKSYLFWTYPRGSFHYDVMVTLILVFVFLSPYWINFKDKPIERVPHQTGVVIQPDGKGGFIYQIEASELNARTEDGMRDEMLAIIEPITGAAAISKYEAVRDGSGHVQSYKVWVQKE